jgi:hypothetical protein
MSQHIQHLQRTQIDIAKWNDCVAHAFNGLMYGYSFYLDAMTDNWSGLVLGEYEAVMPLPTKSKLGLQYTFTPNFVAHLGPYMRTENFAETAKLFLQALPKAFRYADLNLSNALANFSDGKWIERKNYVLPLNASYEAISKQYTEDGKKNLRRAAKFNLSTKEEVNVDELIALYKEQYGQKSSISENDFERFRKLIVVLQAKGMIENLSVFENDKLTASAIFLKDAKRLYYILGAPTNQGRENKSMHFLIDALIKKYANSTMLLDFEGSDFPNVAAFYKKFGSTPVLYHQVKMNRLPRLVRWMKG